MDKILIEKFIIMVKKMSEKEDIIEETLKFFKENIFADGLGIRLKEKGDYPYYTTIGFSDHFIKAENFLCKRGEDDSVSIDNDGKFILECVCGGVLKKNTNPNIPCFTKRGSFWTNDNTQYTDDIAKTISCSIRGRCNRDGYRSIIIVPIPFQDKNVGIIQLNCKEKNSFSIDVVETIEELAIMLGQVLGKIIELEDEKEKQKKAMAQNILITIKDLQEAAHNILDK